METQTLNHELTIDDLPEEDIDGPRHELIDGSLYVTPLGDVRHQDVVGNIYVALRLAVPRNLRVLPGSNVIHSPKDLVIPDVVVATMEAVRRGGTGVAPADLVLAVEVESPSTGRRDRTIKRDAYAEWGIPHYWLVDPRQERIQHFGREPQPTWLTGISHVDVFGEPSA